MESFLASVDVILFVYDDNEPRTVYYNILDQCDLVSCFDRAYWGRHRISVRGRKWSIHNANVPQLSPGADLIYLSGANGASGNKPYRHVASSHSEAITVQRDALALLLCFARQQNLTWRVVPNLRGPR